MKRLAILISVVALVSLGFASPVLGAVPGGDTYGGRVTVSLGYSDTLDTTDATTDADDVDINSDCGAPATDASVWYELAATADGGVVVDVSGSDYSTGVIVATGSPGSFELRSCGPGAVGFYGEAGVTYAILVFDYQGDEVGNGGTLTIVVDEAPPPPEVALTVDPVGRFVSSTGAARISGTVTCTGQAEFTGIEIQARQRVGRVYIDGYGYIEGFACDGSVQPWSAEVYGQNGTFKGGKAMTVTFAYACGVFDCGIGFDEQVIQLKGGKR